MNHFFLSLLSALTLTLSTGALAGPGHDHGDESPTVAAPNAPKRQPDGAVFLPKSSQRQMNVRTVPSAQLALARTIELNGKVLTDANAGGRVQSMIVGRIEPGPDGLPALGKRVKRGEILAYVTPSTTPIEKANQLALLSELRASHSLAKERWDRAERTGARVQTIQPGRVEAVGAWPRIGQTVSAGEELAALVPALSATERSSQLATLAEVKANRDLAIARVARLRELAATVPRKEIETAERERIALDEKLAAAQGGVSGRDSMRSPIDGKIVSIGAAPGQNVEARELVFEIEPLKQSGVPIRATREREQAKSELDGLQGRLNAVSASVGTRDVLRSPADGVIAATHVVAGQVVDVRELVFEIVDPKQLRVEAITYDPSVTQDISTAFVMVNGKRAPLIYQGAAKSLREQALPISFRAEGEAVSGLAVGQPLKVFVQSKQKITGTPLPAGAVVKNPSNQSIVWVKTDAERFSPRTVIFEPLDGETVAITAGLKENERVVTSGVVLLNQVR